MKANQGFTLVEVLVVVGILAFSIVSMIQLFIYTATAAEMAGKMTKAVTEVHDKLEEIRNYDFNSIVAHYHGDVFPPTSITGMGSIDINSQTADLLTINVSLCWQDKFNRIVGEDANLNGVLDSGEDRNGNGIMDCPVQISTMLTKR